MDHAVAAPLHVHAVDTCCLLLLLIPRCLLAREQAVSPAGLTLPRAPLEYFSRCSSKSNILSGGTHWNAESGKKETRKVPGCFIARASSVALSGSTIWPAHSSLKPLSLHQTSALG